MITTIMAAALVTSQPGQPPSVADLYRQTPGCSVDLDAITKLSPFEFDQLPKGWRSLARPNCNAAAADLIAAYRVVNWSRLDASQVAISYWHEGQSRAMAGQTEAAIPLLLAGVNPGLGAAGEQKLLPYSSAFSQYALATVAFLQNDLPGLKAARARLGAVPQPGDFAKLNANSPRPAMWPMNLDVVDRLIACFGKPYAEAYGCRAK